MNGFVRKWQDEASCERPCTAAFRGLLLKRQSTSESEVSKKKFLHDAAAILRTSSRVAPLPGQIVGYCRRPCTLQRAIWRYQLN